MVSVLTTQVVVIFKKQDTTIYRELRQWFREGSELSARGRKGGKR
jgi:hypothetical protein